MGHGGNPQATTMAKNPDFLYHYTTAKGWIGIVQHREIWATDIFYMNDQSEFRRGLHLASKCLRSKVAKENHGDEARRIAEALETLGPGAIGFKLFVCCFSEDQDCLDQWRAYCPRGGYAIGFPFDRLNVCASDQNMWLRRCIYREDEERAIMKRHVNKAGSTSNDLITGLVNESMRYKHAAFEHENEWRLVHWTADVSDNGTLFTKYCFRSHEGRVIPCAKVRLTDGALWREVKVVVGPRPREEMAESMAAVKGLLDYVGSNDQSKVVASTMPYRHW